MPSCPRIPVLTVADTRGYTSRNFRVYPPRIPPETPRIPDPKLEILNSICFAGRGRLRIPGFILDTSLLPDLQIKFYLANAQAVCTDSKGIELPGSLAGNGFTTPNAGGAATSTYQLNNICLHCTVHSISDGVYDTLISQRTTA